MNHGRTIFAQILDRHHKKITCYCQKHNGSEVDDMKPTGEGKSINLSAYDYWKQQRDTEKNNSPRQAPDGSGPSAGAGSDGEKSRRECGSGGTC
jgi:hypothetical protein